MLHSQVVSFAPISLELSYLGLTCINCSFKKVTLALLYASSRLFFFDVANLKFTSIVLRCGSFSQRLKRLFYQANSIPDALVVYSLHSS